MAHVGGLMLYCALWASVAWSCVPDPIYHNRPTDPAPLSTNASRSPTRATGSSFTSEPPDSESTTALPEPYPSARPLDPASLSTEGAYQTGVASYYGKQFHGKPTANGEIFNMYKLTAAHRVLPLGTVVRVTHLNNGRWVEVKINDRGPFVEGRVLDLSFAAALELEMVQAGTAHVMIEVVREVE